MDRMHCVHTKWVHVKGMQIEFTPSSRQTGHVHIGDKVELMWAERCLTFSIFSLLFAYDVRL